MPSNRRLKVVGIVAFLTVLTLVYITSGAKNTYDSQFYTRTVEAIKNRHNAEAHQNTIAEEKQHQDRVSRLKEEHEVAVAKAAAAAKDKDAAHEDSSPLEADAGNSAASAEKSVAGRKKYKDGKVVENKQAAGNDGVAKVGNSNGIKANKPGPETEEDHKTEAVMDDILKKGPIIIFSKSYCPFSKKAKHILLDMYTINPPPYVVELDQHEIGAALQASLHKTTGRRTVPNVLISGKSIGGGDDIEQLHREGKLADTISSMGGKRIVEVKVKHSE